MNLRPLKDRVLIKPDVQPTTTASGLHLAEDWKPEQTGTVVAVGRSCEPVVVPGDLVIFSWQVGQELFVNDGEDRFLMLRECDLLAVVEGIDA